LESQRVYMRKHLEDVRQKSRRDRRRKEAEEGETETESRIFEDKALRWRQDSHA